MRSRNIKCTFYRDSDICRLSLNAQLLFISLWASVDREGKMMLELHQLPMEYPNLAKMNIEKTLNELTDYVKLKGGKFLTIYEVDGVKYLKIYNFSKHQTFDSKEKPKNYPDPTGLPETVSGQPETIPCQRKRTQTSTSKPESINPDFEECWEAYPRKIGKAEALRHYNAQCKNKADMLKAIANYKAEIAELKTEEKYIKHGSTFFNSAWRDYLHKMTKAQIEEKAKRDREEEMRRHDEELNRRVAERMKADEEREAKNGLH